MRFPSSSKCIPVGNLGPHLYGDSGTLLSEQWSIIFSNYDNENWEISLTIIHNTCEYKGKGKRGNMA